MTYEEVVKKAISQYRFILSEKSPQEAPESNGYTTIKNKQR